MLQRIKSHILRHTQPGTASAGACKTHSVAWHVHHNSVAGEKKILYCLSLTSSSGGCLEDAAGSEDLLLLTEDGYSDRYCSVQLYSAMYSVQCQRPGGGQEVILEMITSRSLFRVKHQEATISPLLSLILDISFIIHG